MAQCPYKECDGQLVGKQVVYCVYATVLLFIITQSYTESLDRQAEVKHLLESAMSCPMCDDCAWKGIFRDYEVSKRH